MTFQQILQYLLFLSQTNIYYKNLYGESKKKVKNQQLRKKVSIEHGDTAITLSVSQTLFVSSIKYQITLQINIVHNS